MNDRVIWEWIDVGGGFLRSGLWTPAGTDLTALEAAVQFASNGELLYATQGPPLVGTTAPVGAQYRLTQDVALFNFSTSGGKSIQVAVPAPILALFGADSTVIDPTAALSAAVITAVIGTLSDQYGNVATAYAGGAKGNRRTEQL